MSIAKFITAALTLCSAVRAFACLSRILRIAGHQDGTPTVSCAI